ncbi:phenylalanine--tRNA ligase subunit beta [Berryella wangjianweii]|uniref:Phenylalanine--tRNA ligase beta subunit n=1 Tax=Berryella wangjianweii TaxID=2734634 RepID=A0A6M8IXX8_9ACTN|nr:phenylalanine--tRNA ligase subunit beta [Berryella wangjianweii]QKF07705.1 phenylalanine--tRNA ligase subunit beta [Berryella wangjianweii]
MKVSLKWLSELVDVPADLKELCDRLDLTGTGVEGVDTVGQALDRVVTAQVVSMEPHPDSDHMQVCMVDVGAHHQDEDGRPVPLQVVCGAQNFKAGDHVVTALEGAVLPGDFKIKKSKKRGVVSYGMNCSASELGLNSDHEGIMILPDDAPIGVPFAEYQGLADTVLDLEITPNRPDCLSMAGMAREVGAMYRVPVTYPLHELQEDASLDSAESQVSVKIADSGRCRRYTARVIDDVKVGPSPQWLAERITAAGARPVNNVVDVTNYILFLFGQPLHAFDFHTVAGSDGRADVSVRPATEGEELTTLDGEKRRLMPDMTVIAASGRAVALAGVMGGLDTEISEGTTKVLLEAATFDRSHTSRTSRNLGLISESSLRYERTVDDNPIADYAAMAAALIAEVTGGSVAPGMVDVWPERTVAPELRMRMERFRRMIGASISVEEAADILERLDCQVSQTEEGVLTVVPPTCRPDLAREIDLYEEVLRLWGMDRVQPSLPASPGRVGSRTPAQLLRDKVNTALRATGLNETVTYSLADVADMQRLRMQGEGWGAPVELLNPMSADQGAMRQTLMGGLLRSVAYNQNHGVPNVQLYEVGTVFAAREGSKRPRERQKVAGVLAGCMAEASWNASACAFDFFDAKGAVEALLRELAVAKARFRALDADAAPHLQPGRAAEVLAGGTVLGWVGELHPLAVAAFDAQPAVAAFELDLAALSSVSRPAREYRDVPVFPEVSIDVAFVVNEDVTHERLEQCLSSAGGKLLDGVRLFDVYRDERRLGAGRKSMAYALTYRAADRTLTSEEVEKAHARLVKKVCGATGAEVRA